MYPGMNPSSRVCIYPSTQDAVCSDVSATFHLHQITTSDLSWGFLHFCGACVLVPVLQRHVLTIDRRRQAKHKAKAMMGGPDIKADARRVYEVLKAGGTAIIPASVGYAIMTTNPEALEKMFRTKRRGAHKRHGMGGSYELHKQIHVMSPVHADITYTLTQTFGLTLGVISKFDKEHPMIKNIDQRTMEAATNGDTIAMLINAGLLADEVIKLTSAENLPVLGSSANLSGTGS